MHRYLAWPTAFWALIAGACCSAPPVAPSATEAAIMTTSFPGASQFQGDFLPAGGAVVDGIQSTYDGTIVVTTLDRNVVGKVLPAGTHLAAPVDATLARHPVLLLIGEQRVPSSVSNGNAQPIATAGDYREIILLVPFVVHDTGTLWHNLVVRMYLNDLAAVQGGNLVYGYRKEFAVMGRTVQTDRVSYQVDTLIPSATRFVAEVKVPGAYSPWGAPDPPLPRLGDIQRMFEMPLLGRDGSGSFICSYWEWEFSSAEVAAASTEHRFVSEFAAGMADWVAAGTLANDPDGAIAVRKVRWRMAWELPPWKPAACQF